MVVWTIGNFQWSYTSGLAHKPLVLLKNPGISAYNSYPVAFIKSHRKRIRIPMSADGLEYVMLKCSNTYLLSAAPSTREPYKMRVLGTYSHPKRKIRSSKKYLIREIFKVNIIYKYLFFFLTFSSIYVIFLIH